MALEGILVNGVTEILKSLLPVIAQQISQAWGVEDDLKKLGETLESIQALISDAEEKQITDATVRLWLRRLKDVVYDADDVMDEFCYETMCSRESGSQLKHKERESAQAQSGSQLKPKERESAQPRCGSQLKHKVRAFFSKSTNPLVFNKNMAGEIRAIKKRLDEIYNDRVRYSLNAVGSTSQVDLTREQRNRITTSVANYSDLLGREGASSEVVKMLTNRTLPTSVSASTSSHNNSSLSVVSIVGMGGLGKTSLAQLVYNDESINKYFEKKIWVCISDNFDVYRILKQILESLTGGSCGDLSNDDVLARQVKEKLVGKKYLLVLDDLWNEDAEDWEKLKGFLVHGTGGSKIFVTTRRQQVASLIGGKVHNLQKLTDDVCWSIMQKKIPFPLPQHMISIGRHIAKKCDGLPLAANFLGNLLNSKREESFWVSINDDKGLRVQQAKKGVISILKLSYDNLPSPLKQCFSYCCLFPKDWEIERKKLIWLWIAEGFLQSSEDIKHDEFGDIFSCKMHDLVHDLAMSVVDPNEFGIDGKEDVSQVRRLQLICDSGASTTTAKVLREAKKLRTIVALDPANCLQIRSLLPTNRLRVLYPLRTSSWYSILYRTLIPKFKYLRFLDLSGREFDLSDEVSINHSRNLQTLILCGCKNVSGILRGLVHLKKLRHLDVSFSDIRVLPDDSIANLTDLQTLDLHDCREFEALPENIGLLKHLSFLKFNGCRNFDALPTEFGALTRLRCLDLRDTQIKVLPESCITSLCNLEIVDFGYPCEIPKEIKNWPKLRVFKHRRRKDDVMPRGMEKLTCLETLRSYVVRKEAATYIQERGHHSGIEQLAALNSLQVLVILNLENVRGGREDAERAAKLMDKQNLRELSLYWGSSEEEEDEYDDSVLEGLRPHPNLRELDIWKFGGLSLPNLVKLQLSYCKRCEKLSALGGLPCLRDLSIEDMESVKCLGKEFYYQQQQEEETSTSTSLLFPSLVNLEIRWMENLEEWVSPPPSSSYICVDSFPLLEKLEIYSCPKLRSTPTARQ